jgi:hypothetical protein
MTRRRATTVAPEGRLVLAESAGNSRLFIYMLGNYLHRIERERRTVYFGDLDLGSVWIQRDAITAAAIWIRAAKL